MEINHSDSDRFETEVGVIGELLLNAAIIPSPETSSEMFFWGTICTDPDGKMVVKGFALSGGRLNENGRWLPIARL